MPLSLKLRALLLLSRVVCGESVIMPSVEKARARLRRLTPKRKAAAAVASVADRAIPGPGGDLPLRIYTPDGAGPFPLLMFFHGGGFVMADLDTEDWLCRTLCHLVASADSCKSFGVA